jgi:putative holliday junction resolvase
MQPMKRCLAFDYGLGSTGVAVGDIQTNIVQSLGVLKMHRGRMNGSEIQPFVDAWKPDIFVVGIPLHANGRVQPLTQQAKAFSDALSEYFSIPAVEVDERYSSVDVRAALFEAQGCRGLDKSVVDAQAAVLICQQWLRVQEGP